MKEIASEKDFEKLIEKALSGRRDRYKPRYREYKVDRGDQFPEMTNNCNGFVKDL